MQYPSSRYWRFCSSVTTMGTVVVDMLGLLVCVRRGALCVGRGASVTEFAPESYHFLARHFWERPESSSTELTFTGDFVSKLLSIAVISATVTMPSWMSGLGVS